jgi:hypothetical protein
MSRLKGFFGECLKNRLGTKQATAVALRCKLVNAYVALGTPL